MSPRKMGCTELVRSPRSKQVLRVQGDLVRVLVEGEYRALVKDYLQEEPCLTGRVESVPEQNLGPQFPQGRGADAGGGLCSLMSSWN